MSYWIGLFGLLIGVYSPPAGVLFVIISAGKSFIDDYTRTTPFFAVWMIACGLFYLTGLLDHIQTLNLAFGAGVSCLLLFYLLKKSFDLPRIFMFLLSYNMIFVALRQYLFRTYIVEQYASNVAIAMEKLTAHYGENTESVEFFAEIMKNSQEIYARYNAGLWIATMMLFLMSGYFYFARKREELVPISFYQTHLYVIYGFVVTLGVAILTSYTVYASNILIAITPLFLMQGIGVISSKASRRFTNSIILKIIALLCLVLNPYIVLFVSVIGLVDSWFDFRKITKSEDLNEDYPNGNP